MQPRSTNRGLNVAEKLVFRLCSRSFLSLWSYANPRGKAPGKELCDILVVCDPDVIIFSVKEITIGDAIDQAVNQERWFKRAIEGSVKQIYGAERWIRSATHVIRKDGSAGLPFPERSSLRIHRVAVALGGQGKVWKSFGDFGKGFVHVFDEESLNAVMTELDTITDFIEYLSDKEAYYRNGGMTLFDGSGEEDLLALYLHFNRGFPSDPELGVPDMIILDENLWESFQAKPEYERKKLADRESYAWDQLVEVYCHDVLNEHLEIGFQPSDLERIARMMARENRFNRRLLGGKFAEFMARSSPSLPDKQRLRSRMVPSHSGVVYVFLTRPHGYPRDLRSKELGLRCYIARGVNPYKYDTVIGIATEQPEDGKGFTLDSFYLWMKDWTDEDQRKIDLMRNELDFFNKPVETRVKWDEYPSS